MKPWRENEEDMLRRSYGKIDRDVIAKKLGRTIRSIDAKADVLGLDKIGNIPKLTDEEKQWVFELHYRYGLSYQEIAEKFEVSRAVVGCAVREKRREHFNGMVGEGAVCNGAHA